MVIDTISNILQQIINNFLLFKDRKEKLNEKALNEIIDPLFNDLTKVVENYFDIFRTAREIVTNNSASWLKPKIGEIAKLRDQNVVDRTKVRELIAALKEENNNPLLIDFAEKTEMFFYSSRSKTTRQKETKGSRAAKLVEDLYDYVEYKEVPKEAFLKMINDTIKQMERNWKAVARSYSVIRLKLVNAKVSVKPK